MIVAVRRIRPPLLPRLIRRVPDEAQLMVANLFVHRAKPTADCRIGEQRLAHLQVVLTGSDQFDALALGGGLTLAWRNPARLDLPRLPNQCSKVDAVGRGGMEMLPTVARLLSDVEFRRLTRSVFPSGVARLRSARRAIHR